MRNNWAGGEEIIASRFRWCARWIFAFIATFLTFPADAQNIDAGKSPAQIFATTCTACHRRPQELRRTSASFLRSHYTTGSDEAAAMAGYLSTISADPRAQQQKRQPGVGPAESAPLRRQDQKDQAKSTQAPAVAGKSRRTGTTEAKAPAAPTSPSEIKPPEQASPPEPASPPPPALEPFEE